MAGCALPFLVKVFVVWIGFNNALLEVSAARITGADDAVPESNASKVQSSVSRKQHWREVAWPFDQEKSQSLHSAHQWFSWRQQRFLAVVMVLSCVTIGITYLVASGIQMMLQARRLRQALKNQMLSQNQVLSVQAVIEARQELLRSLVDLSRYCNDDADCEAKVLVVFFSEVMERIWDCRKCGMLDDEVQAVLETALESNEDCSSVGERRQLCLDLLASVLQHATPQMQGKLLSAIARGLQQQIRTLVKQGLLARKALLDAAAAKDTDGMLDQRLGFLLREEASCTSGGKGCGFFNFS